MTALRRRLDLVAIGFIAFGAVVGGIVGGVLSAYWWDFGDDAWRYEDYTVPFYVILGAVVGVIIASFLTAIAAACIFVMRRWHRPRNQRVARPPNPQNGGSAP